MTSADPTRTRAKLFTGLQLQKTVPWLVVAVALAGCCGSPKKSEAVRKDNSSPITDKPAAIATPAGQIPDIPEGTSPPPTLAEWASGHPVNTQGANAIPSDCSMKIVREWLKINCSGSITGISNMEGFGNKGSNYYESIVIGKYADFVVRLRKGTPMKVRILRQTPHSASLFVNWPGGSPRPTIIALGIYQGR